MLILILLMGNQYLSSLVKHFESEIREILQKNILENNVELPVDQFFIDKIIMVLNYYIY